jgi:hypothetical protein
VEFLSAPGRPTSCHLVRGAAIGSPHRAPRRRPRMDPRKRLPDLRTIRDLSPRSAARVPPPGRFPNFNPWHGGLHIPRPRDRAVGGDEVRRGRQLRPPDRSANPRRGGIPRGTFGVRKAASAALHPRPASCARRAAPTSRPTEARCRARPGGGGIGSSGS